IQLRPPYHAAASHLDRRDPRRIKRKETLYPLAVGDLAQGKVRVDPAVLARDANPFEGLGALALALDHPDHDPHRVTRLELRNGPVGGELFDLLALDLLKKVHRSTSRSLPLLHVARRSCAARWRSHKSGRRSRVRRSASDRRQ